MTDYLKPTFTVPGPADDLEKNPIDDVETGYVCPECGGPLTYGPAHMDKRDVDAKRPRKRVCFGKVIAK